MPNGATDRRSTAIAGIGSNIAAERARRRIRQEDLARRAGINRRTLSDVEAGRDGNLSTFLLIIDALGIVRPYPFHCKLQLVGRGPQAHAR